jgi:hypothetical protein
VAKPTASTPKAKRLQEIWRRPPRRDSEIHRRRAVSNRATTTIPTINGLFRSAAQNELVRCENFLEAAYSRHEKVGSDSALAQTALESRGAGRSGFTRRLRAILAGASCALALAYCFIPTSKWMTPKLILPLLGPSMVTFIPSSSSAPARA